MGPFDRDHGGGHPILFLGCLLIVALIVWLLISWQQRRSALAHGPSVHSSGSAEAILAERFARGEISAHDFAAARAVLRGETPPNPPSDTP